MKKYTNEEIVESLRKWDPGNQPWVFDCDGTIINGDIASMTAWSLLRSGLAHPDRLPEDWNEYKDTPLDYETFNQLRQKVIDRRGVSGMFEWEILLHSGLPPATVSQSCELIFAEALQEKLAYFAQPTASIATMVQGRAWMVSGSPKICVGVIASKLGIPPERIISTDVETVDGIYVPKVKAPGTIWEDLKRTELERLGIKPWIVFGDSIGDWAMMQLASTRWCVIWDEFRHRGMQFREILEDNVFGKGTLPKEAGIYVENVENVRYIIEVKRPE